MYLDSNDLCWQFVYWEYIWSNIMHKYMTTILLSWKLALPVLELGKVFIHTSPNQSTLANFTSTQLVG